ncbi:hypothetical protein ACIBEJ_07265 [Nonomuraea sp. NPDC050790]|uniref:hypothetical protein n=1 Tax=Nonomuraea sp. NPDC050790 TaxID=3364371 RepID=UPI0037A31F6D
MNRIDRLVAGIAPDPGPGITPLAHELMEEITTLPVPPPPRARRRRFVASAVALMAVVLAVGLAQATPAAAALDIHREGDHYVIKVNDLFADPRVYESELRARGLRITLRIAPTSASMARSILVMNDIDGLRAGRAVSGDGPITTIEGPGPCARFGGCPTGLKLPINYDKSAEIVLGRRAQPGEKYTLPPGIGMPGEPLHCVDYVNKTVAQVQAMLRERGVRPEFVSAGQGARPEAPANWYTHDGVMSADGLALLLVAPEPRSGKPPAHATCS